jgi:hypothetical protein
MSATNTIASNRALPAQTSPEAAGIFSNDDATAMSPDALMVYCQKRLQDCDTQINNAFQQQEQHNKSSSAITDLVKVLQSTAQSTNLSADEKQRVMDAFQAALDATANDPQAHDAIAAQRIAFMTTGQIAESDANKTIYHGAGDDNAAIDGTKEVQPMIDSLNQTQKDLNSGAELSMINLQTLMSQRQTAVSVCTNLVQKLNDTMSQITGNLGK